MRARARLALSRCRTFAAARASSTSRRAPTTRATSRRSAGCSRAVASAHARADRSRSASRSAAMRCCAGPRRPATRRARTRARRRGGVVAARPRRRRPRDRPRLQPAGLHAHVPAHDEAQGAGEAGAASRACSTASGCCAARDLYEFDDVFTAPLHGFRDADDYWRARLGQAAPARASASRRWCSTRATIRSCRRLGLPRAGEVGAVRDAVAAGARRPRRLRRRRAGPGHRARPCPSGVAGLARRHR